MNPSRPTWNNNLATPKSHLRTRTGIRGAISTISALRGLTDLAGWHFVQKNAPLFRQAPRRRQVAMEPQRHQNASVPLEGLLEDWRPENRISPHTNGKAHTPGTQICPLIIEESRFKDVSDAPIR